MPSKINPQACFFVSRAHLYFFSLDKDELFNLPLSSEIVQDLEIISQISLERVLKNWLDQTKMIPGQAVLLLDSSVCFQHKLANIPTDNGQELQDFLAIVPFSEVRQKTFTLQEGAVITAVNDNFFQPLITTLEKIGFIIVSVSPAFIFNLDSSQTPFAKEVALQVLQNSELLLNYSFLALEEVEAKLVKPKPFLSIKFDSKLIALIIVFIVLIGILVGLLKMQGVI